MHNCAVRLRIPILDSLTVDRLEIGGFGCLVVILCTYLHYLVMKNKVEKYDNAVR